MRTTALLITSCVTLAACTASRPVSLDPRAQEGTEWKVVTVTLRQPVALSWRSAPPAGTTRTLPTVNGATGRLVTVTGDSLIVYPFMIRRGRWTREIRDNDTEIRIARANVLRVSKTEFSAKRTLIGIGTGVGVVLLALVALLSAASATM
jgi:hypothetical protein